ncbi:MAG: cyclopropane fatty acyl phospholipid synthase [Calditrichaeota bacterium]|nr:cyclopropane fatty acyl phospholipid synthase [Calditrichota bacterium]
MKAEQIVQGLLSEAGIKINGPEQWDIQVKDNRFYQRILSDHALGLGESYMDDWWECEALDEFISRLLKARIDEKVKGNWKMALYILQSKLFNRQKRSRASQVSEQHYDLGNDFYQTMLDKRMNYTCAYWKNAKNLDQAQEAKLDLVCKKIGLEKGMTVLELGCGWGSFAKFAAEKYGAHVVAVNISTQQVEFAREYCKALPVEIRHQDYREAEGKYDRVISIGILEHVGYKNYRTYMEVAHRCLKDDGIAFIHTIGNNVSTTYVNAWTNKYIFPNGMLPSIAQISKALEGLFVIEDLHNIGPDYDKTLLAWYNNFEKSWPKFKDRYGERFFRMWRFYLLSSAGGFRSRQHQLWQFVMTKPGRKQPHCRIC